MDYTEVNPMGGDSQGSFQIGPHICTLQVAESSLSCFQREDGGSIMEKDQHEVGSFPYDALTGGVSPFGQHMNLA